MAITKIESMTEYYPEFLVANLNYTGDWPPDLNFGCQKRNLVAQVTILVEKIEPCCS
jgi:hypothetical protein